MTKNKMQNKENKNNRSSTMFSETHNSMLCYVLGLTNYPNRILVPKNERTKEYIRKPESVKTVICLEWTRQCCQETVFVDY